MDVSKISSAAIASAEAVKQGNAQATQAQSPKAVTSHGDTTRLSSAGLATGGSDVRTDKIAQVQQALASGSYKVSSSDVADKIISTLLGQ